MLPCIFRKAIFPVRLKWPNTTNINVNVEGKQEDTIFILTDSRELRHETVVGHKRLHAKCKTYNFILTFLTVHVEKKLQCRSCLLKGVRVT